MNKAARAEEMAFLWPYFVCKETHFTSMCGNYKVARSKLLVKSLLGSMYTQ
jgi:hypothetical protein